MTHNTAAMKARPAAPTGAPTASSFGPPPASSLGWSLWKRGMAVFVMTAVLLGQVWVLPAHAFLGFGSFGIKDEKELGRKFEVLIRSQLPLVEDPEVAEYVKSIVTKLSKHIPPQPFTFTSGVVLHNALNAFAVPGGHVFVFTGLLMQMDNESELAGVLAHELSHVTQRHVAARMERAKYLTIATLLLAVAGIAAGGAGGGALAAGAMGAGQSAMLNYSRVDENEADHIGYQYLVAAGYPPQGMAGGFQKIRQKSILSGSNIPTYLSTHPDLGDRINGIMARIKAAPAEVRNRKESNIRFHRVQTLLWARYGDVQAARHRFGKVTTGLTLMGAAMLFSRENKVQEATETFDKAIAAAPNDPLVLREAGTFHYRKGDMAKAERLLRTAMQKDSRDYMARFFYARLLDETGRTLQAEPFYKDVLRDLPQDQEVHAAYARSLGRSGKHFQAYLHLGYSALFSNDKRRTKQYAEQAKGQVKTPQDQAELDRFSARYKERKEIWDEGM